MTDTPLDDSLAALHDELERLADGAPLDEARMLELVTEVEERLAHPESAPPAEGVVANVKRWAERLELEHPRVAALLGRIMSSLGNTGI